MTMTEARIDFIPDIDPEKEAAEVNARAITEPENKESVAHLGPLGEYCENAAEHIEETMTEIQNLQSSYIEASKVVAKNVRQIARIHFEQSNRQEKRIKKAIDDITKLREEFNVT